MVAACIGDLIGDFDFNVIMVLDSLLLQFFVDLFLSHSIFES